MVACSRVSQVVLCTTALAGSLCVLSSLDLTSSESSLRGGRRLFVGPTGVVGTVVANHGDDIAYHGAQLGGHYVNAAGHVANAGAAVGGHMVNAGAHVGGHVVNAGGHMVRAGTQLGGHYVNAASHVGDHMVNVGGHMVRAGSHVGGHMVNAGGHIANAGATLGGHYVGAVSHVGSHVGNHIRNFGDFVRYLGEQLRAGFVYVFRGEWLPDCNPMAPAGTIDHCEYQTYVKAWILFFQAVFATVYYFTVVRFYPHWMGPSMYSAQLQAQSAPAATFQCNNPANCLLSWLCPQARAAHTFDRTGVLEYWCGCLSMLMCPFCTLCYANACTDLNPKLGGAPQNVFASIACTWLCSCCVISQDAESLDAATGARTECCGVSGQAMPYGPPGMYPGAPGCGPVYPGGSGVFPGQQMMPIAVPY